MIRVNALLVSLLFTGSLTANPVDDLDIIGSAKLRVLFWNIYSSSLYSPNGQFEGVKPGLALEIRYRRSITAAQLIARTREEWQQQKLAQSNSEDWLTALGSIWPDVRPGDALVLRVQNDLSSQFYFNSEPIGQINEPEFTRNFLAIWLSENSSYPRLREQLVGR